MDLEQRTLVNELTQGKELANQLKNHFDSATTSPKSCEFLVEKILSCYEKAISMLLPLESPNHPLAGGSPRSEGSGHQCHKDVSKKRKTLPQWSQEVRICSGTGQGVSLDDGYNWRKYGQKDILGSNFPRAYYRCTHRHIRGCLATKQVQKSDEDPSIFEITYRGKHTCISSSHLTTALTSLEKEVPKPQEGKEIQKQTQEKGLKTEDLGTSEEIFPSFSFPSTPIESENVESQLFLESMMENNFMGNYSPPFISPATSELNYFSLSPCQMNNFGMVQNFQSADSDLNEIISAPNSLTNSPIGNLDSFLDRVDFDPNCPFEIPEFFL